LSFSRRRTEAEALPQLECREAYQREGYETRIPKGFFVYEVAISDVKEAVRKAKQLLQQEGAEILVLCEPVASIASVYLKGKKVASHLEIVLGKGSIAAPPPPLTEDFLVLEKDAWGEAIRADLSALSEDLSFWSCGRR